MNIPSWSQCEESVKKGSATPLEIFIYDNEPAGSQDEVKFRKQLLELMNYVCLGNLTGFNKPD